MIWVFFKRHTVATHVPRYDIFAINTPVRCLYVIIQAALSQQVMWKSLSQLVKALSKHGVCVQRWLQVKYDNR